MALEGQHKARLTVEATTASASKEVRRLQKSVSDLEKQVEDVEEKTDEPFELKFQFNESIIDRVTQLVQKLDELSQQSLGYQAISQNLTIDIGKAAAATGGLITEMDLAKQATAAVRLGVVKNGEEFAQLAEAAMKLGMSIGEGPTESIESLVAALGKGETELLDNLGINLKVSQAQELLAKELGVTTKELTDQQRAEAFMIVGRKKAIDASKDITLATDGYAASIQRAKTSVLDFRDSLLGASTVLGSKKDALAQLDDSLLYNLDTLDAHYWKQQEIIEALQAAGLSYRDAKDSLSMLNGELERREQVKVEEKIAAENKARDDALQAQRERIVALERERELAEALGRNEAVLIALFEQESDARIQLAMATRDKEELDKLLHERDKAQAKRQAEEWEDAAERAKKAAQKAKAEFDKLFTGGRDASSAPDIRDILDDLDAEANARWEMTRDNMRRSSELIAAERELESARTQTVVQGSVDRLAQLESEHRARLEIAETLRQSELAALQSEQQRIAFELQTEYDKTRRAELENERAQVIHEQRLIRIDREKAAVESQALFEIAVAEEREKRETARLEQQRQIVDVSTSLLEAGATIAELAVEREGAAGERAARAFMRFKGIMAIAQGSYQIVEAVAAFASQNYVQGAAHVAAAATAFATGAQLMAGNPGGGQGRGAGATPTDSRFQLQKREAPDRGDAPTIPGSSSDRSGRTSGAASGKGKGDTYVFNVTGSIDEASALKIAQGLDRLGMQRRSNA